MNNNKLTVAFGSDLHLEHGKLVIDKSNLPNAEVLLLAGDIIEVDILKSPKGYALFKYFLLDLAEVYPEIYLTLGNHEYYGSSFEVAEKLYRDVIEEIGVNARLLNNECVELRPGLNLIASTLWTDMGKDDFFCKHAAKTHMGDFHHIGKEDRAFSVQDYMFEHNKSKGYIKHCVENIKAKDPDAQIIVMTHHLPSYQSIAPRWRGSALNGAYASELSDFILDNDGVIKAWVHGHTHDKTKYQIGGCTVYCNPRGYVSEKISKEFNFEVFEVKHTNELD